MLTETSGEYVAYSVCKLTHKEVHEIAKVAYTAVVTFATQVDAILRVDWDTINVHAQSKFVNGVAKLLQNPAATPEELHNEWRNYKIKQGWTYAPAYNQEYKHHPQLLLYKYLSKDRKQKDLLFHGVVRALIAGKEL